MTCECEWVDVRERKPGGGSEEGVLATSSTQKLNKSSLDCFYVE